MKRIALSVTVLLIIALSASAAGGAFVVSPGDEATLVSVSGEALLTANWITEITPYGAENRLFAAYTLGEGDDAAVGRLYKGDGTLAGDATFDDIFYCADDRLIVYRNGFYGVVDGALAEIIPCAYTQIVGNGAGGYLALRTDPDDMSPDGVYALSEQGEERATGARVYYGLGAFEDGLMRAVSAENGRMGYLDGSGQWAIRAQYDYAGAFVGEAAEASLDTGFGLIDRQGNWLLTPKYLYTSITDSAAPLIMAQESGERICLIDPATYAETAVFTGTDIYYECFPDTPLAVIYLDDRTVVVDAAGTEHLSLGVDAVIDAWSPAHNRVIAREGDWGTRTTYLYTETGARVAGPYNEIEAIGTADGRALYAGYLFEAERVVEDADWLSYAETPGTRTAVILDENGAEALPARACMNVVLDPAGVLCYTQEDNAVLVTDLQGETVYEQAASAEEDFDLFAEEAA